jgi:hypothetical protein
MRAFATYAIGEGQTAAVERGYVPLSSEMVAAGTAAIAEIGSPTVTDKSGGGRGHRGGGGTNGGTVGLPTKTGSDAGSSGPSASSSGTSGDVSLPVAPGVDNATRELLTSAAQTTQAASSNASSGPVRLPPSAQALGPAGGPAGVVRGMAVYFGVPILIVVGLFCVAVGSLPTVLDRIGPRLPARLRWVTV